MSSALPINVETSLETLDFLPFTTVDYSGGVIITDWYSDQDSNESIKITIRFLSNDIRADSLKIMSIKENAIKIIVKLLFQIAI